MTEDFEDLTDEYWSWFYSSKMRIKRRVLRMERETARTLFSILSKSNSLNDAQLASDIEWLLTWKLKTRCCPELMWCDGIEFSSIEQTGKYTVCIEGFVWVGPEGQDELINVPVTAKLTLKPNGKQFKNYWFKIYYKDQVFLPKRT